MARSSTITTKSRGECTFDENDIVVFDLGSGVIKVGFSGEFKPRFIFESVIGEVKEKPKDDKEDLSNLKVSMKYGKDVLAVEGTTWCEKLRVPIINGSINPDKGEDTLRLIIEHAFEKLHVNWEDTSILLCDTPGTSLEQRQKVVSMLFEIFKVKAVSVMNSAVLSLFSTGKTRGLVVEIGHESSWAVPVFEGFAIPHFSFSIPIGGKHITNSLCDLVMVDASLKDKFSDSDGPTRLWLDALKSQRCQVAPVSLEESLDDDFATPEEKAFQLPDAMRTIIEVPPEIRFGPAEILFGGCSLAPSPVDPKAECRTLQDIIKKCLESVDPILAAELSSNIVLSGASSCFPGIAERLRHELEQKVTLGLVSILEINADKDRANSAWRGGSMIASMSTFNSFLLGRKTYDESKTSKTNPITRLAW